MRGGAEERERAFGVVSGVSGLRIGCAAGKSVHFAVSSSVLFGTFGTLLRHTLRRAMSRRRATRPS